MTSTTHPAVELRRTSELEAFDVVHVYGMRVRLDECHVWHNDAIADPTIYTWHGTVLNTAELPPSMGPIGKWTVQGNDLRSWAVEVSA